MSPQPEINVGLVGHVDHGKTTLTEALTGKWTDTHSEEIKRGITIRLGYADTVLKVCKKCKAPEKYTVLDKCAKCGGPSEPLRKISFVDAPGHESLMATMLAGATLMDGCLLLIAANEPCPQPQTQEHLMALQIVGITKIVIVQNKIDLVLTKEALKNFEQIENFVKGTPYEKSPIIPVSAQQKVNLDLLIQAIEEEIPTPKRDPTKPPILQVARSFDINKPGTMFDKIVGGVLGGALKQGELKMNDEIEIRPGRKVSKKGKEIWTPLTTTISGLQTGGQNVSKVGPGGSVGVMTLLDPSLVKSDRLVGSLVGKPGELPPVWEKLNLEVHLLERVVGAKDKLVVEPIKAGENLMLNVNSAATVGLVAQVQKDNLTLNFKLPVCAEKGSRMTISRLIGSRWRLIGYGIIE